MTNNEDLRVEVMDHRMQVDMDELGTEMNKNEFLESGAIDRNRDMQQQEEEDDVPDYTVNKMLPKQSHRERLIQQNIKLKTQIYELAKQLDQILVRDRNKKKKVGLTSIDEEDQIIRDRKLQLKKQQIDIMETKNKIFVAKRQLDTVYNNANIQAKEDEIKNLRGELRAVEEEKEGLANIKKMQIKALKVVRNEEEYTAKMTAVKEEYNRIKTETKSMIEKINLSEKFLMKTHQSYISKLERIKELEQKLALNKEKAKQKKPTQATITEDMIAALESEIKQMEVERRDGEKLWQDKIRAVDGELMLRRTEEERKLMLLRQKEKELKLNQLRIKQLRKLIKQGQNGNNIATNSMNTQRNSSSMQKPPQDMDMSQYRHKRNIRYIQK